MSNLLADWPSSLTYLLLVLSILWLWICPIFNFGEEIKTLAALGLSLVGAFLGLFSARLGWAGIAGLILLAALYMHLLIHQRGKKWEFPLFLFAVLASLVFMAHRFPGFYNWKILSEYKISHDSVAFSLYLNYDKPFVGLLILLWSPQILAKTKQDWKKIGLVLLQLYPLIVLTLVGSALLMGYVRLDPKWPYFTWIWLLRNLLMVVVAEEALFRGLIQERVGTWSKNPLLGLIVSAVLFGLLHFAGGIQYVLLSILAGFFYGYAFHKTQKIEAPILLHLAVNLTHFLLFSYPALEK